MNWLVIIVIAIIALSAYNGHRTGFIKTSLSMFSIIIVVVLTINLSPLVSKMIQNNDKIKSSIQENISNILEDEIKKEKKGESKKKAEQVKSIETLPLPSGIKSALIDNNNSEVYKALGVTLFSDYIANYITVVVINSIAFVVTFIVLTVILSIVIIGLNILSKLPVLNGMNKTAGLLLGLLQGFIIVWLSCIVLTMFSTTKGGHAMFEMINESVFLSTLYNNNYLLTFIVNLSKTIF